MGVVFSRREVEQGCVPVPGAHRKAASFMLDSLFDPDALDQAAEKFMDRELGNDQLELELPALNQTGVEAAMVYGSTAIGAAGRRSDVDILLVYSIDAARTTLPAIQQVINLAEAEHHAAVEPKLVTAKDLYNPALHGLDPLYAAHLLEIQDERPEWTRNHPADPLRSLNFREADEQALRLLAIRYLAAKRKTIEGGIVAYRGGEPDLKLFRRVLELPNAIGRKVLWAVEKPGETLPHISEKYAMMTATLANLRQYAPKWDNRRADRAMRRLIDLDEDYSGLLEDTIGGQTSPEDYEKWIRDNYMEACHDAHDVAASWIDIIAGQEDVAAADYVVGSGEFSPFEMAKAVGEGMYEG